MRHPFEDLIDNGYVTVTLKVIDKEKALNSLCEEFVEATESRDITFKGFQFFNVRIGTEARIENLKADILKVLDQHTRLL